MTRPTVLILRPEPAASKTAQAFAQLGFTPLVAPLFDAAPLPCDDAIPATLDGVMITSANAVRYGGDVLPSLSRLPIYAVGKSTAAAIHAATGRTDLHLAPEGTVQSLLHLAKAEGRQHLLHISGLEIRPADPLGLQITRRIVYRMGRVAQLPPVVALHWPSIAMIVLHSPRAAAVWDELCRSSGLTPENRTIIAISAATAAPLHPTDWPHIHIAATPDDDAILALADKLCHEPSSGIAGE